MEEKRPKELGYLFVVGGPGGSGSTTISKMLSRHFNLRHVYGGQFMREFAKSKGFESIEEFVKNTTDEEIFEYDKKIDEKLKRLAFSKDILIESKIFSALCTKYRINTTVKIWLDASIEERARRKSLSGGSIEQIKRDLSERYENDKERYKELYNIDYDSPKKYNDIVIDISNMNEHQTFNLIIKLIEDGRYTEW